MDSGHVAVNITVWRSCTLDACSAGRVESCREKVLWKSADNLPDLGLEAHVQHPVLSGRSDQTLWTLWTPTPPWCQGSASSRTRYRTDLTSTATDNPAPRQSPTPVPEFLTQTH